MLLLELELLASPDPGTIQYVSLPATQYVHKRTERFVYSSYVRDDCVPISYVEMEEVTSDRNLNLVSRGWAVARNRRRDELKSVYDIRNTKVFNSTAKSILATDEKYINSQGREVPLFYKHQLPTGTTRCHLEVLQDGNLQVLDEGYRFDEKLGAIFTNYENFSSDKGYGIFFVNGATASGGFRHLLDPRPVATEATWEDIDPVLGTLIPERKVYSVTQSGSNFIYTFSKSGRWFIKPARESLLEATLPGGRTLQESWYLRITNGLISDAVDGVGRIYSLPEYMTQGFVPYAPLRFTNYSRVERITGKILKLPVRGLRVASDMPLELRVYNSEGVLVKLLTSSQARLGQREGDVWWELGIDSWESRNSYIALSVEIDDSWSFTASYFYESKDFEYTALNLNPVYNHKMRDHTAVFYLIPEAEERALHHLLVNRDGKIVECSQSEGLYYPNLQLTGTGGAYNPDTVIGMPYQSETDPSFLSEYTAGYGGPHGYLVVAEVGFSLTQIPEDVLEFDVQRQGMSIYQDKFQKVLRQNPRILQSILGFGSSGQEVPFVGSVVMELPVDLLEEYGGDFEKKEAEDAARKHFPASGALVFRWTHPESRLEATSLVQNEVDLTWTWEGPDFYYKLYRKDGSSGVWNLLTTMSSLVPVQFSYTDSTVVSGNIYSYAVSCEADYEYPKGNQITLKVA